MENIALADMFRMTDFSQCRKILDSYQEIGSLETLFNSSRSRGTFLYKYNLVTVFSDIEGKSSLKLLVLSVS